MTVFILVVLGGIGLILMVVSLGWLFVAIRRHPHLLRISGAVVSVEKKYNSVGDTVTFLPVIAYTTPEGKQVKFRSTSGSTQNILRLSGPNVSPWRDGQRIDVFHDPSGTLGPCIASLWGLYGWPAVLLVGGIVLWMIVANKWHHLGGQ